MKKFLKAQNAIASKKGEGYIDTAVKILIAVVVGAMFLIGIYTLIQKVVLPTTESKVTSLFEYTSTVA